METPNGWKLFEAASRGLPKPLQDVLNGTRSAVLTAEEATQLRVAVNDIPRLSRELARATPEYKNLERPFVEFASNVGKKMGQLPGKREPAGIVERGRAFGTVAVAVHFDGAFERVPAVPCREAPSRAEEPSRRRCEIR